MITVCAITGVDPIGHMEAIHKTQDAIPFPTKFEFRWKPGMTLQQYSVFIVKHLHEIIQTEHVLICQADGYGRNQSLWSPEFLDYDYVGAVWNWPPFVGNGGVSLRSKKFLQASATLDFPEGPEDIFLCCENRDKLEREGILFAPVDVAKRFSFEHPLESDPLWTADMSWAFHGKWNQSSLGHDPS